MAKIKPPNGIDFAECRTLGHAWKYTTVILLDRRTFEQGRVCQRCETERYVEIDRRTGKLGKTRYKYVRDYQVKGGVNRDRLLLNLVENAFKTEGTQ